MRTNFICSILALPVMLLTLLGGTLAMAQDQTTSSAPQASKKVAIFVKNRAAKVPEDRVPVLEDLVAAQMGQIGLSVISKDDVTSAIKKMEGEKDLDAILAHNTSALRLAQNLGASYVLVPSITTFGMDKATYNGEKVKTEVTEYKLRVTLKLLNIADGGTETSDVAEVSKRFMQTEQLKTESDVLNDLLSDASVALAATMQKKIEQKKIPDAVAAPGNVKFEVVCSMADLSIPEIIKDEKGEYIVTANRYKVDVMAANVEVDGIVVGTTGGPLEARGGLAKVRVSREGFKDWSQTVNLRNGQVFNVAMQMDAPGYARWRQNASFLNDLKADSKLTDAKVKAWEGFAKFLEQSGYKIDNKTTINTTQPSNYNYNNWRNN